MSNLTEFCEIPRTMYEIEAEGFTRDMVYGAVKRGRAGEPKPKRRMGENQARRWALHRGRTGTDL